MTLFRSRFLQAAAVVVLAFCALRFGIQPPVPWSVIKIYMFVVVAAVLIYVSSDSDSWRSFLAPIRSTLVDPDQRVLRGALMIVIPLLVGYYAYSQAAGRPEAPPELRAVHPAPPASIQFRGKELSIQGLDNPLRKDEAPLPNQAAHGGEISLPNSA